MNSAEREWLKFFPKLSPQNVLEKFIPLLGEAWEEQKASCKEGDFEDVITRRLCIYLQKETRKRNMDWGVLSQPEVITSDQNGEGKIIGRCDLSISVACRTYIYECKRLWTEGVNPTFTRSARLYVTQGLRRFLQPSSNQSSVEPQYPSWFGFAGMIGYVMTGQTAEAVSSIQHAINQHEHMHSQEMHCDPNCLVTDSQHFRTDHTDCCNKSVSVYHLLLPLSS